MSNFKIPNYVLLLYDPSFLLPSLRSELPLILHLEISAVLFLGLQNSGLILDFSSSYSSALLEFRSLIWDQVPTTQIIIVDCRVVVAK